MKIEQAYVEDMNKKLSPSYFAINPLYKQLSHPPTNMYINIHRNSNNK